MRSINVHQARKLAVDYGWQTFEHAGERHTFTISFFRPDQGSVWARFSPAGMLTKLEADDRITGKRLIPRRDKGTRLSHWLSEGII